MTIKLLQILSVMTLVIVITVGQATDVFAYKMFFDDGVSSQTCDDDDNTCDVDFATTGSIFITDPDAVCDQVASQVSTPLVILLLWSCVL